MVTDASEFVFGGNGLTDLEALALNFDSNGDGVLDASDTGFAQFGVWQDADLDGVNDDGEFQTLEDLGITSISLSSDGVSYTAADGDVHVSGTTSYTNADGSTGSVADAAFNTRAIARESEIALAAAFGGAIIAAAHNGSQFFALDGDADQHVNLAVADESAQSLLVETHSDGGAKSTMQFGDHAPAEVEPSTEHDFHSEESDAQAEISLQMAEIDEATIGDVSGDQEAPGDDQFLVFADSGSVMDALLSLGQGGEKEADSQDTNEDAAKQVLAELADGGQVDQMLDQLVGDDHPVGDTSPTGDAASLLATQLQEHTFAFEYNVHADDDASLAAAQAA